MSISPEIADYLAGHPDVIVEQFAKEKGITPRGVVHALPSQMRRFADGSRFVEAMADVATWGDVTLIVHTEDGIMEFGGAVPAGQISRGYYNIPGTSGFHGHLRHERCSEIAFLERPFMGRLSRSCSSIAKTTSCSRYLSGATKPAISRHSNLNNSGC